jgi:hypothetical protein
LPKYTGEMTTREWWKNKNSYNSNPGSVSATELKEI